MKLTTISGKLIGWAIACHKRSILRAIRKSEDKVLRQQKRAEAWAKTVATLAKIHSEACDEVQLSKHLAEVTCTQGIKELNALPKNY